MARTRRKKTPAEKERANRDKVLNPVRKRVERMSQRLYEIHQSFSGEGQRILNMEGPQDLRFQVSRLLSTITQARLALFTEEELVKLGFDELLVKNPNGPFGHATGFFRGTQLKLGMTPEEVVNVMGKRRSA